MISVGCCYMSLTPATLTADKQAGFPMCKELQDPHDHPPICALLDPHDHGNPTLSRAGELACHACEGWAASPPDAHRNHAHRALLEAVLVEQPGYQQSSRVGRMRIRSGHCSREGRSEREYDRDVFMQYAQTVLTRMSIRVSDDEVQAVHSRASFPSPAFAVLYALRLVVARAVESLFLTDRALFLLRSGARVAMGPLFDPIHSPRNIVIVAMKNENIL